MKMNAAQKAEIVSQYGRNPQDTGSPSSQVALLTQRIVHLTAHMKANPNDNHTRRGLIGLVSKRRKLLKYFKTKDMQAYRDLISRLSLRDTF